MTDFAATLPRILVVDDEPIIIRMLNEVLKSHYDLQVATSGTEALATAVSDTPELILLDVGLPDIDGYEVCRQLRDNPETRLIPIIFLTKHDKQENILLGFEVGGSDYVLKNAGVKELMARINTHLQLQQQRITLEAALEQNRRQNEKMASLGLLAAGVAHEINNPMGYISTNLKVLAKYFEQITQHVRQANDGTCAPAEERKGTLQVENILDDGFDLIKESMEGVERVTKIVLELKNFARMDALVQKPVVLNDCLESALTISHNELKYVATIRKEYGTVPEILCHPGQLSQVFLNLLVNAAQSIVPMGEIVLRSWYDEEHVYASVSDTGKGIPKENLKRIFEPFFTTKDVGQGTGLGLSVSHDIIAKHHGELLVESIIDAGSTFTVILPRNNPSEPAP